MSLKIDLKKTKATPLGYAGANEGDVSSEAISIEHVLKKR